MTNKFETIHSTFATSIDGPVGDGWEFACLQCAYRVRYYHNGHPDRYILEVLDLGDPNSRHTNPANQDVVNTKLLDDPDDFKLTLPESDGLSPEIRRQIEAILRKFE